MSIDGVPINMVSHAHGQGFSDTNFIIPEVVERVEITKGPYFASQGDFATAGAVTSRDSVGDVPSEPAAKLAILKAWEADERALLRAEDEGMGGGEHPHLHKVQAAIARLTNELCSGTATERTPVWA